MSASIHYRQVSDTDPTLKRTLAPSSFMESMERAFGHFPRVVGPESVATLRGMSAVAKLDEEHDPYLEIIELIEKLGAIKLYATY